MIGEGRGGAGGVRARADVKTSAGLEPLRAERKRPTFTVNVGRFQHFGKELWKQARFGLYLDVRLRQALQEAKVVVHAGVRAQLLQSQIHPRLLAGGALGPHGAQQRSGASQRQEQSHSHE